MRIVADLLPAKEVPRVLYTVRGFPLTNGEAGSAAKGLRAAAS